MFKFAVIKKLLKQKKKEFHGKNKLCLYKQLFVCINILKFIEVKFKVN